MTNKTYIKITKTGCAPCNAIAQFLESNGLNRDNVIEVTDSSTASLIIKGEVEVGKLYEVLVDDFPEVAGHFELASVPTIVEIVDGKQGYSLSGFVPPYLEEMINNLK